MQRDGETGAKEWQAEEFGTRAEEAKDKCEATRYVARSWAHPILGPGLAHGTGTDIGCETPRVWADLEPFPYSDL